MRFLVLVSACAITLASSCTPEPEPPPPPGASFSEVRSSDEAASPRASGGLSVADVDGDGQLDVFLSAGYSLTNLLGAGGVTPSAQRSLRGGGDGKFTPAPPDAAALEVPAVTVALVDLDGDGDEDLVLPEADASDDAQLPSVDHLFENDGGAFVYRGTLGEAVAGTAYAICAADYDGDGDLDLFVVHHTDVDGLSFDASGYAVGQRDRLYRNDGDFAFTDVTETSGSLGEPRLWSNACLAQDYDGDGDLDLWVAYENTPRGITLHRNDGGLSFTDVSEDTLTVPGHVGNWMGFAAGDYDGDGDVDVFVTNMGIGAYALGGTSVTDNDDGTALHMLLERQDDGRYRDVAPDVVVDTDFELPESYAEYPEAARGLAGLDFGWTAWFVDYDNDGDEDLFFAGAWAVSARAQVIGSARTGANPGRLLENDGSGRFRDVGAAAGVQNVDAEGFIQNGWGSAFADLDQDGFLDLLLVNQWFANEAHPGGLRVWRNEGNENRGLDVVLKASSSAPYGYGAIVTLETSAGTQVRERTAASSISSQDTGPVHFGVRAGVTAQKLTVRWPSGAISELSDVPASGTVVVEEP